MAGTIVSLWPNLRIFVGTSINYETLIYSTHITRENKRLTKTDKTENIQQLNSDSYIFYR